jgi:hypothetical protein
MSMAEQLANDKQPRYGRGVAETWWYDRTKALKVARTRPIWVAASKPPRVGSFERKRRKSTKRKKRT